MTQSIQQQFPFSKIDSSWTLFLDRDGVINEEKYLDYIYSYDEFRFMEGVLEAMQILSGIFTNIILVTNQRGVGRGLMTEESLLDIQERMSADVHHAGGRIDRMYYCTANDNDHPNRKPNPGMAFQAKEDLPSIDLSKSIMVGNKLSDMEFGKKAGMFTVHVRTTNPEIKPPHPLIDLSCENLLEFARSCQQAATR